jgi:hypothetical protein
MEQLIFFLIVGFIALVPEHFVGGLESQMPQPSQPAPAGAKAPTPQPPAGTAFDWLRLPSDLRRAVLLGEILGSPRALQPYRGRPL